MKWKRNLILGSSAFLSFFSLLLFIAIFMADEPSSSSTRIEFGESSVSVSQDTLKHRSLVEKYAKKEKIEDYINVLLAIIEVESGGKLPDVMQSSESRGLPPNTIDNPEESIQQGVAYFAELVRSAKTLEADEQSVIQAYNYGGGFLNYVAKHGKAYSFELAESFSKEQANGEKATYTHPAAVNKNGGWRYNYGNMFYVELVNQYLSTSSEKFNDKTVQAIMDEALKYERYPYVFGGYNPTTSFDCSGLTQWAFQKVGISLPRVAQDQYDVMEHLPLSEAEPGDLVFFHSTYDAGTFVTHVGIYVGNNKMYQAGDPIGYADLTSVYWQAHLIGAGRIKE